MSSAYERLVQFLDTKMQVAHIYQPVMLEVLLTHGGRAPIRTIAAAILSHDESQIDYYTEIVKQMPGRVLGRHGIVKRQGADYAIVDDLRDLSEAECNDLVTRCREKVERFKERRGAAWNTVGRRPGLSRAVCATTRLSVPRGAANSAESRTRSERWTSIIFCRGLRGARTIPTTCCRLCAGGAIRTRAPAMRPTSVASARATRRESQVARSARSVNKH